MTLYVCPCGKEEEEITKAKIMFRDNKWVADVICSCNKYMDSKPVDGMPSLKRTEASLSKEKRHDRLWSSAKEKLIGERGINESFD
tara:strand:+ start:2643 stop:2900 length:258 start_codon:yes stop_codon:yes gene_type:complete